MLFVISYLLRFNFYVLIVCFFTAYDFCLLFLLFFISCLLF
ncbi:putative membrane protein [Helicobacter pylori R018c]|uniref:Putative membrane protein n=1 Tax=Helicobacter pylori R018c TaxID=1145110 RepID=K2JV25_HELPX|nr:putative membrane protein [Helicobacter pylori R018c]